jgi:aspartyl-tRNA(Asn)/glutamyl-tRNA(Gln) amidotransferase subunit B
MTIKGKSGEWEIVVGIETHAHVTSKAKLFSGASTAFGAEPNTQVSTVDAAFPGMLPVINRFCIEQAVKTGLGLDAEINLTSVFDRKNYFYADLPAGYQISQFTKPIVGKGKIALDMPDGSAREIGITRLHLEQDAGKSLHDRHPSLTYVDLNRAGVALMEIVSEPDIRSAEEAGAYVRKLRSIMRYLGTCDGNMEEGSLRCDCNVSVRKPGAPLGTRCEIKNVNSVRFVMAAIEYEARRQIGVLEEGGRIDQETRLYDAAKGETRPMRSKEESHDYRYFPDPDLLPLVLDKSWVEKLKVGLPELPDAKQARFVKDYKLSPYQAATLVVEQRDADAWEKLHLNINQVVSISGSSTSNTVINTVSFIASERGMTTAEFIEKRDVQGALILQHTNVISSRQLKPVLEKIADTHKTAEQIVKEMDLKQVTDSGEIERAIDAVLAKESANITKYRAGNEKLLGYFVGQVMKATQGKANPTLLNELLKKKLSG